MPLDDGPGGDQELIRRIDASPESDERGLAIGPLLGPD
ncbi:hypothetical protein FHU29_001983 [Hoyosella altamirensis]|uniref:Uncharacterized protein n=1 Tax=Hoyosella altamirensis TaxID=616997 RepID=A0A839RN08_9ACTN|nr:hypothetical protein [Hoyosella altamirensis]